ncbi:MAG: metallophosphatase family protein [Planctomycetes bacterium]|nr:metallophosphatase family protein [Planctomycetota bacterium]
MSNDETIIIPHIQPEPPGPFAVISDVHGNLEALQVVLDDIEEQGFDRIVCLGDIVGYGPNPVECWRLIQNAASTIIMGNHDLALSTFDTPRFHPRARSAIEWSRQRIAEEKDGAAITNAIALLPRSVEDGDVLFVHGSPAGVTMDYLLPGDAFDQTRMRREFAQVELYAFNGHSHIPGVVEIGEPFRPPEALEDETYVMSGRKAIINVGSVGQPRDNNPRTCYITVKDWLVKYHRLTYPVEKTVHKIFDTESLDPFLGRRLLIGH